MRVAERKPAPAHDRARISGATPSGSRRASPSRIRYRSLLARHVLNRHLADVRLSEVESAHVLHFYADTRASASASTVKKVHSLLHSAFEAALHTRVGLNRNPCDLPRNQRPKYKPCDPAHPFDADKEGAFLTACDGDPWEALYVLALERDAAGGTVRTRMGDIDWDHCSVEVRRTLKDTEDGLAVGETKNRQRRAILLSAAVTRSTTSDTRARRFSCRTGNRGSCPAEWCTSDSRRGLCLSP